MTRRGKRPVNSAAQAIRIILVVQVGIAAILFGRDIVTALPNLGLAPTAPGLDLPVRPGDQVRRYDPRRTQTRPARPGQPMPPAREMPPRLQFDRDGPATATLTGEIAIGDGDRFTEWLDGQDGLTTLRLDSPGGSVTDALDIGRAVRSAGLNTELVEAAQCLSACPYILAAGAKRRVHPGAFVGVHQHYFGENIALPAFIAVEDIQRGQGAVLEHLLEMGIDPALMRHSLSTPPDQIYILLAEELTDYRLVTSLD